MKKYFLVLVAALVLPLMLSAKENEATRYEGLAVGAYFSNSYAAGDWSKYVVAGIGGGVSAEYTLPFEISVFDIGISLRAEYDALLPAKDSVVESAFDIMILPGAFLRFPIFLDGVTAAFVPEVSYGLVMHNLKGKYNSDIDGFYTDQLISIATGLRLSVPKLEALEVEVSPMCLLGFEKSGVLLQPGFRAGALWHFSK